MDIYNPYTLKIDLNTAEGRKAYARSTKGLEDDHKYDMSVEGADDFFYAAMQASEEYCWGDVVKNIGVDWNPRGNVGGTKNPFEDRSNLTFDEVEDAAKNRYANGYTNVIAVDGVKEATHQKRLRAAMIAWWVLNSLIIDRKRELMLEEESFTFTYPDSKQKEQDGQSMLKIIFDKVNPNTTVGVIKYNKFPQNAHVGNHE